MNKVPLERPRQTPIKQGNPKSSNDMEATTPKVSGAFQAEGEDCLSRKQAEQKALAQR